MRYILNGLKVLYLLIFLENYWINLSWWLRICTTMNRAGAILTKHSSPSASVNICIVCAFVFVWLFICICMTLYLYPLWAGGTLSTPDQTFLSISFDQWPSFPIPSSLSSRFNSEVSRISICQILLRWQISLLFFFMFFFFIWWNISYFAPWCSFSKTMCLKIFGQ